MKKYIPLPLIAALVFLVVLVSSCTPPAINSGNSYAGGRYGPGGMMGNGGMMGGGTIGPGGPYRNSGQRLSMEQALNIAEKNLTDGNESNLEIDEIMEFEYNFYVIFVEKSTGINAFEALIDPYTGDMYPEPGPNMMWNSKYGMMSGMMWGNQSSTGKMTVSEDAATNYAQEFLGSYLPGAETEKPDTFYGYYTLHILQDGKIYGMLSVNGYTGQVWYHSWHGQFLGMKELAKS